MAANAIPIVMEDALVHTDEQPFCTDLECPCHTDSYLLDLVDQAVKRGFFSPAHATEIIAGTRSSNVQVGNVLVHLYMLGKRGGIIRLC
jgi:hypothetical protein